EDESAFQNLATSRKKGKKARQEINEGKRTQEAIRAALCSLDPKRRYLDRRDLLRDLKKVLDHAGVGVSAPVRRAIVAALGERDENARVCMSNGAPEPDTDLRDTENVPLKESVEAYFEREVRPFVPDAWIDETRTKIGYEIPFTRHFYEYTPLRPLEEIEAEIRELEREIEGMLEEVLA